MPEPQVGTHTKEPKKVGFIVLSECSPHRLPTGAIPNPLLNYQYMLVCRVAAGPFFMGSEKNLQTVGHGSLN